MYVATMNSNPANNRVNTTSRILRDAGAPTSPPIIEANAKTITIPQSMLTLVPMRDIRPAADAIIITSSDVEEA